MFLRVGAISGFLRCHDHGGMALPPKPKSCLCWNGAASPLSIQRYGSVAVYTQHAFFYYCGGLVLRLSRQRVSVAVPSMDIDGSHCQDLSHHLQFMAKRHPEADGSGQ